MKNIAIINGPNLHNIGSRQPEIYGIDSWEKFYSKLVETHPNITFSYFQSHIEGEIIAHLYSLNSDTDIIINPGAYSHTSVAIADALQAISNKKIEVHISNIHNREDYRHNSITAATCHGCISGMGLFGYKLAVIALLNIALAEA